MSEAIKDVIAQERAKFPTPLGRNALEVLKRSARRIGGGAGLLAKPDGNNIDGYAADIICYPDGRHYDALRDAENAGGAQWVFVGTIDPSRYRPVPGDEPPPPPPPATDLEARVATLEHGLRELKERLRETGTFLTDIGEGL